MTWKRTLLLPDLNVVAFIVDVQCLPVKIEHLLNPEVAHQIQASLDGRRVKVINSRGLAFSVALEAEDPKPKGRLPRRVPLDPSIYSGQNLDARPDGTYLIPVGQGRHGPVWRSLLGTGHILVGGESGSGKFTWLNCMLVTLLSAHSPEELQVAIVDPKSVEFHVYRGVPHLFGPVATEVADAAPLVARILAEMDRRMAFFTRVGAKNLAAYNRRSDEPLPLLLLIVDEVTDIALEAGLKSSFYKDLIRLVSKGRAFGLVVVLATQNPKAEVLNTLIRGNMSTRIAFRVSTADHSRNILGVGGVPSRAPCRDGASRGSLPREQRGLPRASRGAQTLPRTIRGRMMARLDGEPVMLQGFYISD